MAQVRRRGAVLEQAILRAAVEELTESGYPGLTMDRVARRAGTNKNTIYRRWPNRAALGVAAYRQLVEERLGPPDTGELRADVLTVLRQMNRDLSSPRADIARGLMASASEDPELFAQLQELVGDGGSGMWLTMLERAVARGEALPEACHPRVATVAVVLLRNEYVTRGMQSVPDEVILEIVDEVYLPLVGARVADRRPG
ncbi:AcrR family transcriptional regulator [Kutzneria viridogrisea]|uniref:Transcription regulator, TetR family n=2 Tax=Kutzneria TaxID=43356 RepID=W5W9S3_9PSEU|nr:TetR/AcrR family transcriptional regulator [Kutzneria albida]AHH97286.1 transcription regulator, TetR family [Kutzneria albida DSM 43870]MBA8930796.1 AcrR family transcriptional regulator [Kutzneria viridogrisea]